MTNIHCHVKQSLLISGVLLLFSSLAAGHDGEGNAAPLGPLTDAQQEVVDFVHAYGAAFASANIENIGALAVKDGSFSFFEGSAPDWGWDSYRHHMEAELPAFSNAQYRISEVRPTVVEEMAYATYAWELDVTVLSEQFPGGKHPVSMEGIATMVLIRQGDDWKINHLHTSQARASQDGHSPEN